MMKTASNDLLLDERYAHAARFARVRAQSCALAAPLSAEDQTIQSMPDASPTKWHLAHTTWFFETFILKPWQFEYAPFDSQFEYCFNSYYEAAGPRHPRDKRGLLSRPSLEDVHRYRAHVDAAILDMIDRVPRMDPAILFPLLELGLNHEQQHQELMLMDIKHLFACSPLSPRYSAAPLAVSAAAAPPLTWTTFEEGLVIIGGREGRFMFDNEGPPHRVWLERFTLADRLVTNGEFAAFIDDGGYDRPELWLSDGWVHAREARWRAPLYWRDDGRLFTLHGEAAIDPAAPVCHVSYFEADAFARWAGKRLPREEEWEVAAQSLSGDDARECVTLHPARAGTLALSQMYGAAWQWTCSAYSAYPGYRPAAGAIGEYNGKFMCGQFVLRGGACVTPPGHTRATYRNFFPPAAQWAFTGIRLADDA